MVKHLIMYVVGYENVMDISASNVAGARFTL